MDDPDGLAAIHDDDAKKREAALAAISAAPEHVRSAIANKLAATAKTGASTVVAAEEAGREVSGEARRLEWTLVALSLLRVEAAKSCLMRVADEGTPAVKTALARALRGTKTAEGRAVLVHLLSDDDARAPAIVAIAADPWPEVLPALMEVAEAEDDVIGLAIGAIARCGAAFGANERYAVVDFLVELLDDDACLPFAVDALLRGCAWYPAVIDRARRLAKEPGKRKVAGLCLAAASGAEGNASLLELALSGHKLDADAARAFLEPLLEDRSDEVRRAAERAWRALDLR